MTEKEIIVNSICQLNEAIEETNRGLSILNPSLLYCLLYSDELREEYMKTLQGLDDLVSMRDKFADLLFTKYRTIVISNRELD